MSKFNASDAFADPEDPKLVAEAKRMSTESFTYSYTEVPFQRVFSARLVLLLTTA